jgi:MFS family permease
MTPVLGLKQNWRQFTLLVTINAFVGAMVGLERTVLPLLAESRFGLTAHTAVLAFIASFGVVKAFANLLAGQLSERLGRRRVLLVGWLFGLPVPLLIIWAPAWSWVVFANVLLGINQGLCWSTTVIMKIDLAGPRQRGLAMGLNEAAGYAAVAAAAYASALVTYPFHLGLGLAVAGLLLSLLAVETAGHARVEAVTAPPGPSVREQARTLFACNQAGLVNNLNDGVMWGLMPVLLYLKGLVLAEIALVAALYPLVWSAAQLWTGALSDRWGRKWLIAAGMAVQAAAIGGLAVADALPLWLTSSALLGVGTAMVYPTLLAAVSDAVHPERRAVAVGRYRWWRDMGYAAGALLAGTIADRLGVSPAVWATAAVTLLSGLVVAAAMNEPRGQYAGRFGLVQETAGKTGTTSG